MYGAILGDMIGSPYEFDRGSKTKDFPLFSWDSRFTDDSIMTVAVAEALMDTQRGTERKVKSALVRCLQKWGRRYPNAGYGSSFAYWLDEENPMPYGSYGNGSGARVSAAGWLYETLNATRKVARWTAEITHNHPEGIKGAEATAAAIWMARNGKSKQEIRDYISLEFGYDLSRTCDEIRPKYHHIETCQQTVPEAITAFLEGNDFEDVIRTAVSLGGDCDTLACIAGSIAEAFYGVPQELRAECENRLPLDMLTVVQRFEKRKEKAHMIYVQVKYWKSGFYGGAEYTYKTALPLAPNDKVIAPTAKEPRQRAIVTKINVAAPSFPCKEITEYDPEQEVVTV